MFGDFSRFDNNPELGVTGVYLSQGSPILDSAWNEQAAALSDWITLVGRMAAGDTFRRFEFAASLQNGVFSLSRGVAMVAGRVFQTRRAIEAKWSKENKGFDDSRVMTIDPDHTGELVPYFIAIESTARPSSMAIAFPDTPPALQTRIDWRICFAPTTIAFRNNLVQGDVVDPHFRETVARSFGETRHLTPEMTLNWGQPDESFRRKFAGSNLVLIEYHSAVSGRFMFKLASSPDNSIAVDPRRLRQENPVINYHAGQCTVLDDLVSRGKTDLIVELEGPHSGFRLAANLFQDMGAPRRNSYEELKEATIDPISRTITVKMDAISPQGDAEWKLRIWNLTAQSTDLSFPLVPSNQPAPGNPPPPGENKHVRASFPTDSVLLPGDRWYLPLRGGGPVSARGAKELHLPGHRVFRAIAKVDGNIVLDANGLKSGQTAAPGAAAPAPAVPAMLEMAPVEEEVVATRRFDASFHRLTSALDAARELTRKTACKDLPIRVSYLPLRRWLASVSVHEIADLDLDGFLARIRRSLEVPPEEEHLLTEQASLVLEEASRLAGPLPVETIGSRFA